MTDKRDCGSAWNNFSEMDNKIYLTIENMDGICEKCYSTDVDSFTELCPRCGGESCEHCEKNILYKCKCGGDVVEEVTIEVIGKFEVCDVCDGKGRVVNPNIDRHGLTQEDFDADPDFREAYFGGFYDITCPQCNGKRVIPVVDKSKLSPSQMVLLRLHEDNEREDIEYEEMCRRERMYGA